MSKYCSAVRPRDLDPELKVYVCSSIWDSPTSKMQRRPEKFRAQLHPIVPLRRAQREDFMKATTHLAKIAVVLQDAPDKMLTSNQLMDRLALLMSKDRNVFEKSIKFCLSSQQCFIKILVGKGSQNKKNYWKLDFGQITEKMVHRHFIGILHLFPELASKVATEAQSSTLHPEPSACKAQVRPEVKFSSPFSIESLLKRDSPSAGRSRAQQQSQTEHRQAGTKRSFSWDPDESLLYTSAGNSPFCSHVRPIPLHSEPSFPVHTRASAALYFTSPHRSYITYSGPAFPREALCFSIKLFYS